MLRIHWHWEHRSNVRRALDVVNTFRLVTGLFLRRLTEVKPASVSRHVRINARHCISDDHFGINHKIYPIRWENFLYAAKNLKKFLKN